MRQWNDNRFAPIRDEIKVKAKALRRVAYVAGFVAIAMLVSCAVTGRPFERAGASSNQAVIYVYRPYSYAGSLLRPAVTCGDETARIGPGGYHAFVTAPGKVTCSVAAETQDQMEIQAEPRDYYVRETIGWGWMSGRPQLEPVDHDAAHDEIRKCVQEQ